MNQTIFPDVSVLFLRTYCAVSLGLMLPGTAVSAVKLLGYYCRMGSQFICKKDKHNSTNFVIGKLLKCSSEKALL